MNIITSLWISGGIVALGIIVFLSMILYAKHRKSRAIKHYERLRDELSLRKEEVEEVEYDTTSGSSIGGLIGRIVGGFVVLAVGFSLIGPIKEQIQLANATISSGNITSTAPVSSGLAMTILNAVPFFFALAILGFGLTMASAALRDAGIFEGEVKKTEKKYKGIQHYTKMRDKLTIREGDKEYR